MTDHLLIDAQPTVATHHRLPPRSERRTHGTIDAAGTSRAERIRAHAILAALWSGLAVAILAYAITEASIGAAAAGVMTAWAIRLAWSAAWRTSGEDGPTRPLTFIP